MDGGAGGEPASGGSPDASDAQATDGGTDGATPGTGDGGVELGPDGEPCIDPELL